MEVVFFVNQKREQVEVQKALAAGMNAFIPKPFDVEQLYKSIEKFLH